VVENRGVPGKESKTLNQRDVLGMAIAGVMAAVAPYALINATASRANRSPQSIALTPPVDAPRETQPNDQTDATTQAKDRVIRGQDEQQRSPEEQRQLASLEARDREVRAHEQAHLSTAGGLATGPASFTYQRGPNGVNYAVGGEVPLSLRKGQTPEETISNARKIQAAALAPAQPSQQDRNIAAVAGQMALEAVTELARQSNTKAANPPGPITLEEETPRLSRTQTEGLRRYRGEETRSNQLLAMI
jgi:hypothetical protein